MMRRLGRLAVLAVTVVIGCSGCGWHGLNSFALPGTQGRGAGSFTVQAQLADVNNIQENSDVRVGDVKVGAVSKIERQGWHALLTLRLNDDVELPANATVSIGQTSLLGSLHVALAAPTNVPPEGRLRAGSLIPLAANVDIPSTEQTLAAASQLLNGSGIGQLQDVNQALSTAFTGREGDIRSLLDQLTTATRDLNNQTDHIIAATDSINRLAGKFAAQKSTIDKALDTVPQALAVLNDDRDKITEAVDLLGKFGALASDSVNKTKSALTAELEDLGPVLESLANSGPALTRSLSMISTFPFFKDTLDKYFRGDYTNISLIVDLTLSRLDSGLLTGTRFEGKLTKLEMQWGRTIGQLPSPYTANNPLLAPYHFNQGP